jgi:PAS domain S-box-containing protein
MKERIAALEEELCRVRTERDALAAEVARLAQWRAAVEASPNSIMVTNGETGRYEVFNDAFAKVLGLDPEEVRVYDPYRVWLDFTHPDDQEAERHAISRLAAGEIDRYQLEKRVVARGGEPRWVRVNVVAGRAPTGRLERVFVYFTDVQEQHDADEARQQLETQIRQTQKLDALGKLAGGVAHDFNNRLLIIIGYTELLKQGLPPESALAHQAEMVLSSAQRGAELTRQLLAYSRRQVLKPESFNMSQTVDGMRRMLERLIGDRIQLVTRLDAENQVFSDPGQIEQVILNLALNARDAMPAGGRLMLETADVTLRPDDVPPLPPGDYVRFDVTDSGCGIPDEVVPHIFEPFFTTKEVGRGTGLGLSMVDGIVHQSGGAVRVTTRPGEGTRFSVYLPRAREVSEPRYIATEAPSADISVETVMICDDDDGVRSLLADLLRLRAHAILQARNGKHALEVAGQHQGSIRLLITDLVMPEVGGIELATELRKRHPGMRVLYVSGYTEDADVLSEPLGPHTRFLAKPFVPSDLTRLVHAMLETTAPSPREAGRGSG